MKTFSAVQTLLPALVLLTGCQEVRLSQGASRAVDRAKVAVTLDKFQVVRGNWAEEYGRLSVAEMEVFNELRCERQLEGLERRKHLTGDALARQRAETERWCRWTEDMHRLSVERYGVSWNAISGEQLDALGDELPY